MPRVKVKRQSTVTDMTAMCDVAFLLLTFFILTAKFKPDDPLPIDIPASTVQIKVPENNLATLSIVKGRVLFGMSDDDVRGATLERMGKQYNISFTPEEKKRFSSIDAFGVPIKNLKAYIAANGEQRKEMIPGVPIDSTNNELTQWLLQSRYATKELHNKDMRVTLKGDSKEEFPTIRKVINTLQKQKINKFSMITSLRVVK
ncbi:MAG: biopolymer transporter ExbD [Mucilaginibacter polytrichastri]|nr:biopolymer transporter ExbD [Mucilaginibacter polytrichastri]